MAELATPSAATMSTSNAAEAPSTAPAADKTQKVKPERPDEEEFKADLAKAEKEHAAVQERLVGNMLPSVFRSSAFAAGYLLLEQILDC